MSSNNNGRPAVGLRGSMFPQAVEQHELTRKVAGRTVIAHISDLHFSSDTDAGKLPWNALLSDLTRREGKPVDVLAVTGDLVDSPFSGVFGWGDEATAAFAKVCAYLEDLCRQLGIDPAKGLVVVPGNHDYRLKGIVRDKHAPRKFYEKLGAYCRPLLLPSLRLCLFPIDSNTMERTLDLAAGTVERNDLVSFGTLVGKVPEGYSDCTKVVLLHHHPMPIAATENATLFDDPRYTLLKNAGQFMTNMVRSGVSLVLHGHQHSAGYSKAVFPYGSKEHMITVVAAGSAGHGRAEYNLITVLDGGKIELERRSLGGNAYFDTEGENTLLSYDEGRRLGFDATAADSGAKVRVRKLSRLYFIHGGSGDVDAYERSEQTETLGGEVASSERFVKSDSGFFAKPEYTPIWPAPGDQQIKWVWEKETYAPTRKARLYFDPPLAQGRPVTFEAHRKDYNLFHFYQRDREDATNGRWKQEFLEFRLQNVYDLFVVTIRFPEGHWPKSFNCTAHNYRKCANDEHEMDVCAPDALETERFVLHFSEFKDADREAGTAVISLERPLPGYSYWVSWELPEEEASQLSLLDAGTADDFEKELLAARDPAGAQHAAAQNWFKEMRKAIVNAEMWRSLDGSDDMDISLYAYDRARRGLVCVAASLQGGGEAGAARRDEVIKPGTTIIGASYRRKEAMLYCPAVKSQRLGESEYAMRVPKSWQEAEAGAGGRYTAVCTVPLFCPIPDGRRVAVLAFSSRAARSKLLYFAQQGQVGMDRQKQRAVAALRKALLEEVMVGQCKKLADALGVALPPTRRAGSD